MVVLPAGRRPSRELPEDQRHRSPPTPLNSATICGIAVIFTLPAAGPSPRRRHPTAISFQSPTPSTSRVATTRRSPSRRRRHTPPRRAQGEQPQAEDEERERNDVARTDEVDPGARTQEGNAASRARSSASRRAGSGRLNISSMRSVTRKPPTTLIVPNAIAITRISSAGSRRPRRSAGCRRAERSRGSRWSPTSAAYRVFGTFEITSKPTNAASTRIVSSVSRSICLRLASLPVSGRGACRSRARSPASASWTMSPSR